MNDPVLRLKDVGRVFPTPSGPVTALREVTFSVEPGELVAIIGPSGSGKSTLLNVLGLLDRPDSGSYLLYGQDTARLTERDRTRLRAQRIGFVFQAFHLVGHKTAAANVELPLMYTKAPRAGRRGRAEEALARIGLAHRAHALPHTLSGGEKQRVAIARATVHDPVLLLCDEPTGNLDSANSARVMEVLHGLARQGLAVVVVTHDQAVAETADRVLRVRDGVLSEVGKANTDA